MKEVGLIANTVDYSSNLLDAPIARARTVGNSAHNDERPSQFLLLSAGESLILAAAGVFAGFLGCRIKHTRARPLKLLACGVLAFSAGLCWKTRNGGFSAARAALKEASRMRDERWLKLNPINYA